MKIGEKNEIFFEERKLGGLGFLDFDDNVGLGVNLFGCSDDSGTGLFVVSVGKARADTSAFLDEDLVTGRKGVDSGWSKANTVLTNFDFFDCTDNHDSLVAGSWVFIH